jgi:hypothetical protein
VRAVKAHTTAGCERRNHIVAPAKILDSRSCLPDLSDELVAHDKVSSRCLMATIHMKFTGETLATAVIKLADQQSSVVHTFHKALYIEL